MSLTVTAAASTALLVSQLAREFVAGLQALTSLPGFGTGSIDPADLAALRAQEGPAQAILEATIAAMPDPAPKA